MSTRGTERHWIEIFRDRATERLKEILQEDMDWTTSLPILERLNRLHENSAETAARRRLHSPVDPKTSKSNK